MMKYSRLLLLPLLLLLGSAVLYAQEPGRKPDRSIALSWSPSTISAGMGFEVVLRPGSEDKVEVYANNPDHVEVEIDNKRRSLRLDYKIQLDQKESDKLLLAVVTVRDFGKLSRLHAETGSVLRLDEQLTELKLRDLELKCFTGAELYFTGQVDRLSATAGTGGEIYLSGRQTTLSLKCTTGGEIDYKGTFTTGDLRTSSGSDIDITGEGELVNISAKSGSSVDGRGLTVRSATLSADLSSEIAITALDRNRVTESGRGTITVHVAR